MLGFIERLKSLILREQKMVLIDFTHTRQFHADGTLLFFAELDRLMRYRTPRPSIRCIPPKNRKSSHVLHQIGAYRLLKRKGKSLPFEDDVVNWRVAHGTLADGGQYERVLGAFDGRMADPLRTMLYDGVVEAMANTAHHAYIEPRNDGMPALMSGKDWWMFSQERDGILSVVFCDLGIGIPKSLPQQNPALMQRIINYATLKGGVTTDSMIIRRVVRHSLARFIARDGKGARRHSSVEVTSRTGQPNRGRGLGQIAAVTYNGDGGSVAVHSNFGVYSRAGRVREQDKSFKDSIHSTLITWRIPLGEGSGI